MVIAQRFVAFAVLAWVVGIFGVLSLFGAVTSLFADGSPARDRLIRVMATGVISGLVALMLRFTRPRFLVGR